MTYLKPSTSHQYPPIMIVTHLHHTYICPYRLKIGQTATDIWHSVHSRKRFSIALQEFRRETLIVKYIIKGILATPPKAGPPQ